MNIKQHVNLLWSIAWVVVSLLTGVSGYMFGTGHLSIPQFIGSACIYIIVVGGVIIPMFCEIGGEDHG